MGVSYRATHAIEPGDGDLLMPNRSRRLHARRAIDVEDACFEAVSAPRDLFVARSRGGHAGGVFKTQIVHPEAGGPVPRDFASNSIVQGERLDIFGRHKTAPQQHRSMSGNMVFAIVVSAVAAVIAFWMAGGHALVSQPLSGPQTVEKIEPVAEMRSSAVRSPDPVATSSVPVQKLQTSTSGYAAPSPRPARIERAGSILMIRPAAD